MTTASRKRFSPSSPSLSTTPKQRQQFAVLVALAGVTLLLLWILLAPLMYRNDATTASGFALFRRAGNILGTAFSVITQP